MKYYEIRYFSEMIQGRALYGAYKTLDEARAAMSAFYSRAKAMGLKQLCSSMQIESVGY